MFWHQVFFFLALDDPPDGKIDQWRVQRDAQASQLQPFGESFTSFDLLHF